MNTATHRRVDVLGVGISCVDEPYLLAEVEEWIAERSRTYVCVTGVHGVMESQNDERLREIHNHSGMTVADGMPMLWCGRAAGATEMRRLRGPDLMMSVLTLAEQRGWSSYFYGGAEGTADLLVAALQARLPRLRVAGTHTPPFRPLTADEGAAVVEEINASGADLVWVGLSTPKQERWMADFRPRLDAPVLFGVGAAFDVHAGLVRQAPQLIQRSGLEWMFRISQDPGRLFGRYMKNNPRFLLAIVREGVRLCPAT